MPTPLLLYAPIVLPLAAAASQAILGWRRTTAAAGTGTAALALASAALLAATVSRHGPVTTAGGWLRADALSAWMLLIVTTIATLACAASHRYLVTAGTTRRRARWYGIQLHLFIAAMAAAVLAGNLGIGWVAIETTTIVTAFLVGHHRTRTALEAAWKYVVICSAAIAIALLGIVVIYFAARHTGLSGGAALNWATLTSHAHRFDPAVARIGIGLAVVGFGAKAGLVPLHAWLPDAHSQAPTPISALMSGVLLSVSFYTILRLKIVADAAVGVAFVRTLLLILALATLAVAAVLLAGQRDYKRMLAYSSMEHMGLIALAAAVGTRLAIAALLLHIAGHGLAKTVAFLSAGHIQHRCGSSRISSVRALASRAPGLAALFGLAMLALLGLPPASLFASELGIARAGTAAGLGWLIVAGYLLALLAFVAITVRLTQMLLGPTPATGPDTHVIDAPQADTLTLGALTPLILGLAGVAILGVTLGPLTHLLHTAASIVGTR